MGTSKNYDFTKLAIISNSCFKPPQHSFSAMLSSVFIALENSICVWRYPNF